jgi:hypothetical protein
MVIKSYYNHYKHFKTYDNVYIITIKCIILGILGLTIGVIINNLVIYISNKLIIKNKNLQVIIQITLCAIIVSLLHTQHKFIGWTLRNTIPGIFFITLLFTVQYKIFYNINYSNYIMKNDND